MLFYICEIVDSQVTSAFELSLITADEILVVNGSIY